MILSSKCLVRIENRSFEDGCAPGDGPSSHDRAVGGRAAGANTAMISLPLPPKHFLERRVQATRKGLHISDANWISRIHHRLMRQAILGWFTPIK